MPRIATRNAYRLAYRQRFSVGVRMLGCLVLLAGSIVIVAAIADAMKGSSPAHLVRMGMLGGVLVLIGAPLFCGQRGKVFDRQTRSYTTWLGIFRPLWRTTRDLQAFQSVKADAYDAAGVVRWRVYLSNSQGEQLDVFDLADRDAADAAARQLGSFLSLLMAPMPATPTVAPAFPPQPTTIGAAVVSDSCWSYRRSFTPLLRFVGIVMTLLAMVLLVGIVASGKEQGRGFAIAAGATMLLLGLWSLFGCQKVAVDRERQTVRLWRAWPWPPDGYNLDAFYAVAIGLSPVAADSTTEQIAVTNFVGLVDREQQRLDLTELPSREEALALAAGLAGMLQFPLIDERQTIAQTQRVAGTA